MGRNIIYKCILLLVICHMDSFLAMSQLTGGRITGSVRDQSGAAIVKASIDVLNINTNEHIPLVTNNAGSFTTQVLRPGSYTVSVTAKGFESVIQKDITVQIGGESAVNIILAVGSSSETIEVVAQSPIMNTTTAVQGTVVEARPVQELPLNGRNALALTLETPTVHSNSSANPTGFADRGTSLAAIVINNGPTSLNANLLDGVNNLNGYSGELAINPAVDSVQEFKVQSGYMPAEFGLTGGGVITLSTKSGTDSFHWDAYEFLRHDRMDARDYFLGTTSPKPPLRYNQFGGAVGGPILKDKMFFFANHEQYRYRTSRIVIGSVPSAQQRTGDFSDLYTCSNSGGTVKLTLTPIYDPDTTTASGSSFIRTQFPNNKISRALDPVSVNIQNYIYPTANRTPTDQCQALTNTNNYQAIKPAVQQMYQYMGRIDYRPSSKHSFFSRYSYNTFNTDNGTTQGSYLTSPIMNHRYDKFSSHSGIFEYTYIISPSMINELRVAVTRTLFSFKVANYNQNWPSKLGLPSNVPSYVFPQIDGTGLPSITGQVGQRNTTNPQITDSVTLMRGGHTIRFGIDIRQNQANNMQMTIGSGKFTFSSKLTNLPTKTAGTGNAYASFLLGAVNNASLVVYKEPGFWNYYLAGFVQDDWKVTPRLTINAGFRYDLQQEPFEHHNGLSNFSPDAISPNTKLKGTTIYAGYNGSRTFAPNDYKNFGPRLGFAWDVFGDGKTSVRGGAGIYYISLNNGLFLGSTSGFSSTTTSYTSTNAGIYPAFQLSNGFPSAPLQPQGAAGGPDFLLGQAAAYTEPRGNTPMSFQANLSIQRELRWHFVGELGFLANNGSHMVRGDYNMNSLPDQYLSLGDALQQNVANPYAGIVSGTLGATTITRKQSLLPYPYYNSITVSSPRDGTFHGNAMVLSIQRHASNGLTLLSSYTFSKLLDAGIQDPLSGYIGISSAPDKVTPQNVYNRSAEYSLDPSDMKHHFVGSALYDLPFGANKRFLASSKGFVNRMVSGWEVTAIVHMQSGLPLAITGANNNAATRPSWVTGKSAASVNKDKKSINGWFNTDVFENPDPYTYGNVPRVLPNSRGPRYTNMDASIFKTTEVRNNMRIQFRLETFNTLNHPHFSLPNTTFVPASGTNGLNTSSSFGTITSAYLPRNVQLAVKLLF